MISAMLLISFLSLGIASCPKKNDIDIGLFSVKHQKFYFDNEKTGIAYEHGTYDARANKLVCVPYAQYIDYQSRYTCKLKK